MFRKHVEIDYSEQVRNSLKEGEWKEERKDEGNEDSDEEEGKSPIDEIKILQKDINNRYHLCTASIHTILKIDDWSHNRELDKDHVKTLCEVVKKQRENREPEHFDGRFAVVRGTCGGLVLVEGQHRRQAVAELLEKDCVDLKMTVTIHLYDLKTTLKKGDDQIATIFAACNNQKNCTKDDIPSEKLIKLMNMLKNQYKGAIKEKEGYYPTVHEKALVLQLKKKKIGSVGTVEDIFDEIRKLNSEWGVNLQSLSKKGMLEIDGCGKEQAKKALEKAKKKLFYLSLVAKTKNPSYYEWIDVLAERMEKYRKIKDE